MKEFDLTKEQTSEIQLLNAKLISLKTLYKESLIEGNSLLSEKLIVELSKVQISYDNWFNLIQTTLNVSTTSNQSWNVDFNSNKLQLI